MLTRAMLDEIASRPMPVRPLDLPELETTVHVRALRAFERERLEFDLEKEKFGRKRAIYATYVLCDEAGERLFSPGGKADELDQLGRLPWTTLERIAQFQPELDPVAVKPEPQPKSAPQSA